MTHGSVLPLLPAIRLCLLALTMGLVCSSCQSKVEVEHLEHVSPEHKPTSYAEAVEQLQFRITEALNQKGIEHSQTQRLSELGDIIRWLPENAADSDLKKSDWERVEQITQRLEVWQTSLLQTRSTSPEQRQQIETDLQTLAKFTAISDRFQSLASQKNQEEESTDRSVESNLMSNEEQ